MNISILDCYIYICIQKCVHRNHCCAISQACLHNFDCRQNVWLSQEAAERQLGLVSSLNTHLFGLAEEMAKCPPLWRWWAWTESTQQHTREPELGKGSGTAINTPLSCSSNRIRALKWDFFFPSSSPFPKWAPELLFTRRLKWPHQWGYWMKSCHSSAPAWNDPTKAL